MTRLLTWITRVVSAIAEVCTTAGKKLLSLLTEVKQAAWSLFLLITAMAAAFLSAASLSTTADERLLTTGFLFSVIFAIASYLCLGGLLFREDYAPRRVFTAVSFVLFIQPVSYALALYQNNCVADLVSMTDYVLLSYAMFTGSGPSFTDLTGSCRVTAISESISGYLGLALLLATLSSVLPNRSRGQ